MLLTLIVSLGLAPAPDELGIVHVVNTTEQRNLTISLHMKVGPTTSPGELPPQFASDWSFYKAAGKQPADFVFTADIDGGPTDEVVVIKRQTHKGDRYRLSVHQYPTFLSAELGKPIATAHKSSLGSPLSMGDIVAAGSIDRDGDDIDELLLVRRSSSGVLRVEIRGLPTGKHDKIHEIEASYLAVGHAVFDPIVAVAGLDVDGDGVDELALLRAPAEESQEVTVLRAPQVPGDFVPPPMVPVTYDPADGVIVGIDGMDFQDDGTDDLMLVRDGAAGTTGVEVHRVPPAASSIPFSSADAEWSMVLESDLLSEPWAVMTLREASYPIDGTFNLGDLAGDYECTLRYLIPSGAYYTPPVEVVVGPIAGPHTEFDGFDMQLYLADDVVLSGEVIGEAKEDMTYQIEEQTVEFTPGPDSLKVEFQPAQVLVLPTAIELRGKFHGTSPSLGLPILSGEYVFRRDI